MAATDNLPSGNEAAYAFVGEVLTEDPKLVEMRDPEFGSYWLHLAAIRGQKVLER